MPGGRASDRPGGWLLLLAVLITVGEPLALGSVVSRLLPGLGMRGPAVIALLLARLAVTGLGVAAGLALFSRRPHAPGMAKLAVALLGLVSLVGVLTPILPSNRMPGSTGPVALAIAVYYGAWLLYLHRSRRVRETFG